MKYVYGIVGSHVEAKDYAACAFACESGRFEVVKTGEVAAVVSESCVAGFTDLPREKLMRYLTLHQRSIEALMRGSPVLPMKFGTQLHCEEQVRSLLGIGHDEFLRTMEAIGTRHEIDVAVTWDPGQVLARIAGQPEVAAFKAQAEALSGAERTQAGIALGQLVKGLLDAQRNQLRDTLVNALTPCVARWRLGERMDDSMVTNVACLVSAEEEEGLDDRVLELDDQYDGALRFRLVGPLPPYSFATVQARLVQPADLEAACGLLGIPPSSTPEQVKLAYYRQARACHPDVAGEDPAARAQFVRLTAAYRLMVEVAERVPVTNGSYFSGAPQILLRVGGPDA